MRDFSHLREQMVKRQIEARGIDDPRILAAFREVPREAFVSPELAASAYEDSPLPIEAEQTISQPYIVALMIEAAGIRPGEQVLEIGAGSGYAAAVISRIAGKVVALERHAELAQLAGERMTRLGYDNVRSVHVDGTNGWQGGAPYDAIMVAASGSHVPEALKDQLGIQGTLVMPIGEPGGVQTLVKVTRTAEEEFEVEDLGPVRFVPLIGAHGWNEAGTGGEGLVQRLAAAAEPLPEIDDPAFAAAFDRYADARVVLLGEASHGTSEFYRARAAITRRLIERHGFTIVAVEADWPDAAAIDRHVRHRAHREGEERPFHRFPTWMWRNTDVDEFVRWLRAHNHSRSAEEMAGFYGLDLYNLGGSMRAVIDYLDDVDPEAATVARRRYGCLEPYAKNPQRYGRMAFSSGYAHCEQPVISMLQELLANRRSYAEEDGDEFLDAAGNARLVANAEAYYRAMYEGAAESWNLRDTHMFDTLRQILDGKGPDAKAVVWAHNSHIGNAAHTEMGLERGELNIGQLAKERFGDEARLIGFGTHSGAVAAATDWDAPMEVKKLRPSLSGSYERLCHDTGLSRFLLDLRGGGAVEGLEEPRLERFIGVIYRSETERWSHYAAASLPRQFDGWVWFDETEAVTALGPEPQGGEDETYPFGL